MPSPGTGPGNAQSRYRGPPAPSGRHRVPGDSQPCSGGTGDAAQPRFPVEHRWFCVCLVAAANLVLHQTVERIHVGKKYGDIPRGIFVVRGENVVLLGEIDLEKESDTPLQQVSIEEILEEQRVEQQAKQESEKLKVQALKERGLSVPRADTLDEY
ncbi:U6 snRNA-associated Sm-like protein LSm1 [Geospiza fortis]|uniref:U6 snRNA-associated Sm-like protein LSm1 n=1 Tax=Geospiza fortis TaxID=48883 RepID=A0A8N5F4U2_GEOFO|nr:U6 snRNA-associated Sm-like protein LSm1 [Geospiza fortis]